MVKIRITRLIKQEQIYLSPGFQKNLEKQNLKIKSSDQNDKREQLPVTNPDERNQCNIDPEGCLKIQKNKIDCIINQI